MNTFSKKVSPKFNIPAALLKTKKSNRESGSGRFDVMIASMDKKKVLYLKQLVIQKLFLI